MNYKEENNILLKSSLDRMFFKNWHYTNNDRENFKDLELDITFKCDLDCKYCYVARYGDTLYPKDMRKNEVILKNIKILLEWLIENEMNPTLNIFSGELFSQKIGFMSMDLIYDIYKNTKPYLRPSTILIPTNFTFLLSEKLTEKVNVLRDKFRSIGITMILSASVEGKFMEENRPFKNRKEEVRDDRFYDKVFEYCSRYHYGFHPMIYSNNIEKWTDNFLWFQENFKKYNINQLSLYLLEVRNAEWTDVQIKEFRKFYDFIIRWLFDFCSRDGQKFINTISKSRAFNIISSPISSMGRGLGCSIQSTLYVRMGDLKIFPCHRLFYDHFQTAQFKVENDKIVDLDVVNPELSVGVYSAQSDVFPYCNTCLNKYMCSKGCLGAQFETTGDILTPIPTVCKLEYAKSFQLVETFKDLGVLDRIKRRVNSNIETNIEMIEELIKRGEK